MYCIWALLVKKKSEPLFWTALCILEWLMLCLHGHVMSFRQALPHLLRRVRVCLALRDAYSRILSKVCLVWVSCQKSNGASATPLWPCPTFCRSSGIFIPLWWCWMVPTMFCPSSRCPILEAIVSAQWYHYKPPAHAIALSVILLFLPQRDVLLSLDIYVEIGAQSIMLISAQECAQSGRDFRKLKEQAVILTRL